MTFAKAIKLNISVLCVAMLCGGAIAATGTNYGVQAAWDNPTANMAAGSLKPGPRAVFYPSNCVTV